ncbi:NtaA/DmoA family FMN-dependent monooxygenase [Streptomyces sp. DW26H14]|uniref:NtaA/DmoA family FMN-dependent monooxygenase n=1 Tax=Streptomyces sp. DW26H14 TaxID=3435395 RepID=UPI00403E143F
MAEHRQAHLNAFLTLSGYHEGAWRVQDGGDPLAAASVHALAASAAVAERGLLDSVFLADAPFLPVFRAAHFPQIRYDPVSVLAALSMTTRHIGLIATASTTYNSPYELARRLLTVDHLSHGRAGWNIVTTVQDAVAKNFGHEEHPEHDDRYARATEFVEVAWKLWDGWEPGALVGDRASGTWADVTRIHPAEHHGAHYDVAGALPVPRSPQERPVLAQAGSSPAGIDLAARVADLVFTPQPTLEAGQDFRKRLHAAAARYGRSSRSLLVLPGLSFVLGGTQAEATARRRELEDSVAPELRWRNLAFNAGIDQSLIDPSEPLSERAAATAGSSSFARVIVERALGSGLPFEQVAREMPGLPGGLEFTGTPEQLADLIVRWVDAGASDGFTLQPDTVPGALEAFVDHVVPILQARGAHRRQYTESTLRGSLGIGPAPAAFPAERA